MVQKPDGDAVRYRERPVLYREVQSLRERATDGETGRLKGRGRVDTLSGGEVAEWLNAAVSKTVTSVIPASGVRIPPSPHKSQ